MTALVTDAGLKSLVDAFVAADEVKHIGWGGGSGQDVTASDLASAFAESRTSGTLAAATTNTTDDTVRITGMLTAITTRDVTEVGVFSAATGAVLQVYGDFDAVGLVGGDSINFTIDVVIDQE